MTEALQRAHDASGGGATQAWQDPRLPVDDRVADLLGRMTLTEKVHQLLGYWATVSEDGEPVAPMEEEFAALTLGLDEVVDGGLGQLTRVFGTTPLSPADGLARLAELQDRVIKGSRHGIPAIAHEECLTGLAAWTATAFPTPLAWGATFHTELVEEMAGAIAASMRRLGVHQGLAPVVDVTRDYRWGRTEETIGEDPYLVGLIGSAYVRGLERGGVVATLKHFAGYSASRAGRNHAPTALGPRELADVIIEPFVTALREGGARSVMNSYADVDGIPVAADERLLTNLLREQLGFGGVVVSDYSAISLLEAHHGVAASPGDAAALALRAGIDVELPSARCYAGPLIEQVEQGVVPEALVDRAAARVLTQKCELGLLDPGWRERLATTVAAGAELDTLDPPEHRHLARQLAEESVVLLANDGTLPLTAPGRIAVVGPLGDDPMAMLGCYTFPAHVGTKHPELPLGVDIPTLAEALRTELPTTGVSVTRGCAVDGQDGQDDEFDAAVAAARAADVCVLALGDRAGLFGRGTSGEGCDAETLALPGRQAELAAAVLDSGTPTVLVLLSGRPYALGGLAERASAVLQGFFPGEEGGPALAGIIAGRVAPSGRLPVSVPRGPGGQPGTYLHALLGGQHKFSSVDPTSLYPFGHGLTYTEFGYDNLTVEPASGGQGPVPTDGAAHVTATVRNQGDRAGTEVVQLYLSGPAASVVRPVRWLAGWARVDLAPGQAATVAFTVHADRTSFTDAGLRRVVEPGTIQVAVGRSSADLPLRGEFVLDGPERVLGPDRVLTVPVRVTPASG